MKSAAAAINQFTEDDIKSLESTGKYTLNFDGEAFELGMEDFIITSEDIPGWQVANDADLTVALDISITDKLQAEGTARELVNRVQNMRKNKEFNVMDKIVILLEKNDAMAPVLEQFGDYICSETLAVELLTKETVDGEKVDLYNDVVLAVNVELQQ